jgi:hypothetical protein
MNGISADRTVSAVIKQDHPPPRRRRNTDASNGILTSGRDVHPAHVLLRLKRLGRVITKEVTLPGFVAGIERLIIYETVLWKLITS